MVPSRHPLQGGSDYARLVQRGFFRQLGFGERPCVLVIDMLVAFTSPDLPLGCDLESQIHAINALVRTAKDAGVPVIWTSVVYERTDESGLWGQKMAGLATLTKGSEAAVIDPRLLRDSDDMVVVKKFASAFFGTDLDSFLRRQKTDTLILAGCTTSGCVRATAVDAIQLGYRPIVVEEAVGDRTESAHWQSLFDLQAKYADVVSLEQAIRYLKSGGKLGRVPGYGVTP